MSDDQQPASDHDPAEPERPADAAAPAPDQDAHAADAVAARPRTSRLAIASTAVSLASLLGIPLLAVIGPALGVVAINRIRANGLGGLRWAVAGIVIGLAWLATLLVLIATGVIEPADAQNG